MAVELKSGESEVAEKEISVAKEKTNSEKMQPANQNGELEEKKIEEGETKEEKNMETEASSSAIEKNSSFREESNLVSDLKDNEKKALKELRSKMEDAISKNELLDAKRIESEKIEKASKGDQPEEENGNTDTDRKGKSSMDEGKKGNTQNEEIINENIRLWGVPLLPSKGDESTDVILLKFLRARDFKVDEAFRMLKKTLQWRKENNVDSVVNEDLSPDLSALAWMDGLDRQGHPVCYNVYGYFGGDEIYKNVFETEENRQKLVRWRFQLMEKWIQKLNFKPGADGISSLVQINDLKNTPGPSKKELRLATKQAVDLLHDNYPEFVAINIFINVPFWYYAFSALFSAFLTQRSKSKIVLSRPSRVTETLLKYIAPEQIPVNYGGLKRDNDSEFSPEDGVLEAAIKSGGTETIEIPTPEEGGVTVWDMNVLGWEVNYKEEFVPRDENSYTIIVQKVRKMGWQEEAVRNSFKNNEPGNIVISIENGMFKKKRALYRYKSKTQF